MKAPLKRVDRRIQRTRQLLTQAFREIIREKGFRALSIQDITQRANVNRGTFYTHFTDKYALLYTMSREDFSALLASKLPPIEEWNKRTLQMLIQTVLEHCENIRSHRQLLNETGHLNDISLLIERAAYEELTEILVIWLKQGWSGKNRWELPVDRIARVVSGTIFGVATEWSQETTDTSSKQMADTILQVIMKGVEHLNLDALPG